MQALKNNYEKILLGILLVAFVGSGFYWLSYLRNVREVAREGDLIPITGINNKLDTLTDDDFVAMQKLQSPTVTWGELDGKFTGNAFKARPYMRCINPNCAFWIAFRIEKCPHCGTDQKLTPDTQDPVITGEDNDQDGIPDDVEVTQEFLSPIRPRDAQLDQDLDWFTNLEEYTYFKGDDEKYDGTSMADPAKHPPLATRLRLLRVDRDLFGIRLASVMAVDDQPKEKWDIALKVREGNKWRSRFLKVGQSIAGYTVIDAQERYEMRYNEAVKDTVRVDVSTVTIQKDNEEPLVLTRGERKYVGTVADIVLEMTPTQAKVIRGVRAGDRIQLPDSLGRVEEYEIHAEGQTITAALVRDGQPGSPVEVDRTRKVRRPQRQTFEPGMGDDMPMEFPGTGMPPDMMYTPPPR